MKDALKRLWWSPGAMVQEVTSGENVGSLLTTHPNINCFRHTWTLNPSMRVTPRSALLPEFLSYRFLVGKETGHEKQKIGSISPLLNHLLRYVITMNTLAIDVMTNIGASFSKCCPAFRADFSFLCVDICLWNSLKMCFCVTINPAYWFQYSLKMKVLSENDLVDVFSGSRPFWGS